MGDKKGNKKGNNGNAHAFNARLKRDAAVIVAALSRARPKATSSTAVKPKRPKTRKRHGRH